MSLKDAIFSGSRERVIAEEAFLPALEEAATGLLSLRNIVLSGAGKEWSRRFVSRVLKEVHTLRTVLNDYDARENRTYAYFAELVSAIRGFATVLYILKHLRERFLRSPLRDVEPDGDRFLDRISRALWFTGSTLRRLFSALIDECESLELNLPDDVTNGTSEAPAAPPVKRHLPHNLDEEDMTREGEKVGQVASMFLRAAEIYGMVVPAGDLKTYPELREFVIGKLDEELSRAIQSKIHAIQSKYDTYIQYTATEQKDPDLRRLRSVISIVLHLFEVTTHLVHFYERHENDIRSELAKERIARIVDKAEVLDLTVNFTFRGAEWLMREGQRVSERLIPTYTSIRRITLPIPSEIKLHIRPAALIAAITNHHGTPVRMHMGGDECDASSVTDVIFLAGSNIDAREVTFDGDEAPLADLRTLFRIGLREEGHAALHEELAYLKRT